MEKNQMKELLRLVVGGYLVYLGYDLFRSGQGQTLFLAAAGFFALTGGALVIYSGRNLLRRNHNPPPPENQEEDTGP